MVYLQVSFSTSNVSRKSSFILAKNAKENRISRKFPALRASSNTLEYWFPSGHSIYGNIRSIYGIVVSICGKILLKQLSLFLSISRHAYANVWQILLCRPSNLVMNVSLCCLCVCRRLGHKTLSTSSTLTEFVKQ